MGQTQLATKGSWSLFSPQAGLPVTAQGMHQGQPLGRVSSHPTAALPDGCGTRTRRALPPISDSVGRPWPTPDALLFSTPKDYTCGMPEVPNLILTDVCLCICGTDMLGRIFHLFFPARKVSDNPLLGILTPTLLFSPTLFYLLLHCIVI